VTELGLGLQSDKTPAEYAHLARLAEDGGFDVVTVFHDLLYQPSLPALIHVAQATERVRVGPSCLNPFTLHPVEIAGQVAALDAASGGRAYLGLARGAWLDESLDLDVSRPLTALREAWEIVRRLLAGDGGGFDGELFSLARGRTLRYEPPRREVPLLVGSWGRRIARWAAGTAQELKIGGSANPEMVRVMRERLGTDAVKIVVGAVTVVDEDGAAARAHARREVALYLPVVAELDPTVELPAGLVEELRAGADGSSIPDELLDRFAFSGTPERVAAQAQALFEAGAGRVEFGTPHGVPEEHGVALLASRVVPSLR
jgi:5,10-methylenetetrahydromethanopterin reductase